MKIDISIAIIFFSFVRSLDRWEIWSWTNKFKISRWDTWKLFNLTLDYALYCAYFYCNADIVDTLYVVVFKRFITMSNTIHTNGLFFLKLPLWTIVCAIFQDLSVCAYMLTIYVNQAIHKIRVCITIFIWNTSLTHVSQNANRRPIHG